MPGNGIGPQIIKPTLEFVELAGKIAGEDIVFHHIPIGTGAYDRTGSHLPASSLREIELMDASLKGPVGGPPNSEDPRYKDIEKEAVIRFRKKLGLDTSLRWVDTSLSQVIPELSPLKPEFVQDTDLVVVRDLAGDVYNGRSGSRLSRLGGKLARTFFETNGYSKNQVDRTIEVGIEEAERRGDGRITLVHKTNVLKSTGGLWKRRFDTKMEETDGDFAADYMHVDNAVQAIMGESDRFGVIVTSNLFGDIVSDLTAKIMGSLGMGGGAEIGKDNRIYGPIHGSAPGYHYGMANPSGTMLGSIRMVEDFDMPETARLMRQSLGKVLDSGHMTLDLWVKAREARNISFVPKWCSTKTFGALVIAELEKLAA
jgi:3-isopropylmalate dehydrogenase